MQTLKKLFLDDVRQPREAYVAHTNYNKIFLDHDWTIVRDVKEFTEHLETHGLPDIVSFDYYLKSDWETGFDCAKILVRYCIKHKLQLPQYFAHSASYEGRTEILKFLDYQAESIKDDAAS